tara:strand:+ start:497 stop:718 length:222 start_codon:yes stop_codon:yes gene_type:complete
MCYNGPGYPPGGVWAADSASTPKQGGSAALESASFGAAVESHSVKFVICLKLRFSFYQNTQLGDSRCCKTYVS